MPITRRELVVGAFAATAVSRQTALAQEAEGPFRLDPLPYPANALAPYIDAKTMEIHHDVHHRAYVNGLNSAVKDHAQVTAMPLQDILGRLSEMPEGIRTALRNFGGGHANHSMFWKLLAAKAGGAPSGKLGDDIKATFGSFDAFKEKFEAAGIGRFGSGWAWLVWNKGKLEIVSTANQDNPLMGKAVSGTEGVPVLGCDVWEHAYYLKYQNRRADYLKAFWNVVNWSEAARNYDHLKP